MGINGKRPRIVEIVGLAGSGKSTLTNQLCGRNGVIQGEDFATPSLGHWARYAGYCVRETVSLTPMLLDLCRKSRHLTRDHVKKIIYLNGWHRIFQRQNPNSNAIIAVDQGFIFCLATLLAQQSRP